MKSLSRRAPVRSVFFIAAGVLGAAALGCAPKGTAVSSSPAEPQGGATTGPSAARLEVVNAYCPVAGTHPVDEEGRKRTTADLTREWNGQRIGFCCDGCPPFWDEMTDAERREKLAAALDLERRGGPAPK